MNTAFISFLWEMVAHPTAGKKRARRTPSTIASNKKNVLPTKKTRGRPRFAVDTPLRAFWRERQRQYYSTHRTSWNRYMKMWWRGSL